MTRGQQPSPISLWRIEVPCAYVIVPNIFWREIDQFEVEYQHDRLLRILRLVYHYHTDL